MEDRLTDQPEKAVYSRPELRHLNQRLCPAVHKPNLSDDIPESQNQTADDNGRNKGCENLRDIGYRLLNRIHVSFCFLLYFLLGNSFDTGYRGKLIVKHGNIISNNHLKLSCLCKSPLYALKRFDPVSYTHLDVYKRQPDTSSPDPAF